MHPITRLVARLRLPAWHVPLWRVLPDAGARFEAFRRRHTDQQLRNLAAQLGPVALWPDETWSDGSPDDGADTHGQAVLEQVARSLASAPLILGLGIDVLPCVAAPG